MSYIGNQPTSVAFLTDTFSGNGTTTAFTMSVAPATTSSILVSITGVLQDPSTYSVTGVTLNFSAAPPSGTGNISVRYLGIPASGVATTAYRTVTEFTATAGQTTFSVPSYTVGYIDVYRNGVMLGSADYTASNGTTVVLAEGTTAGDLIETISFFVSSVLNAIPASPSSVGTSYLVDGSVTTAKIADNAITTAKIAAGAVVQADLAAGVAGNGPAFFASKSSTQTLSAATFTKVTFDSELFDTNNNFSSSAFTPTVAGYYLISCGLYTGVNTLFIIQAYKNNNTIFEMTRTTTGGGGATIGGSGLIYCNGTTDYIELFAYLLAGGNVGISNTFGWFSAAMVRSA